MPALNESAPLHPACVQCSAAWAKKHQLPAIIPVERALIRRDTNLDYIVVAYCTHGSAETRSDILNLGPITPSDNRVRTARAFA